MKDPIRDIQHRFEVDGRLYIVELRGPRQSPMPVSNNEAQTHITFVATDGITDIDHRSHRRAVNALAEMVRLKLPQRVSSDDWGEFSLRLLVWADAHRKWAHGEIVRPDRSDGNSSDDQPENT